MTVSDEEKPTLTDANKNQMTLTILIWIVSLCCHKPSEQHDAEHSPNMQCHRESANTKAKLHIPKQDELCTCRKQL